jgi:hypothetical protein
VGSASSRVHDDGDDDGLPMTAVQAQHERDGAAGEQRCCAAAVFHGVALDDAHDDRVIPRQRGQVLTLQQRGTCVTILLSSQKYKK